MILLFFQINNKLFRKNLSIINTENDFFILSNNNKLLSKDLQKNDFFFELKA